MKSTVLAIAVVALTSSVASAQWVSQNTYVTPGMGYTRSVPVNPYYAQQHSAAPTFSRAQPYQFAPQFGALTVQRMGNMDLYFGSGNMAPYSGAAFHYGPQTIYNMQGFSGSSQRIGGMTLYNFRAR